MAYDGLVFMGMVNEFLGWETIVFVVCGIVLLYIAATFGWHASGDE